MYQTIYEYNEVHAFRYKFISTGKRDIVKVIEFTPTATCNVYNLAFGDLLTNGELDDLARSNNGDIIKIFATIIDVVRTFTTKNPSFIIYFKGSTPQRTLFYSRILKTYYQYYSTKFDVVGYVDTKNGLLEIPFDPNSKDMYLGFLIKRI
ncbi:MULTISPECIES: DUF6934 family protein [Niastella]|uniref:Uncharacterized protein n=1 Tax=Niastella soli TaxID=2821487 RepID=A0ABS3YPA8_9BACT|nr:hypothetical protein [Niastella soli]MBO9199726.1 hypothetical protein [Niastella soli]